MSATAVVFAYVLYNVAYAVLSLPAGIRSRTSMHSLVATG